MKIDKAFDSLGHETRLKIVEMVLKHSPATLQFIAAGIQRPTANVSHHLKILTDAGILHRAQSGPFSMFTFNHKVITSLVIYLGRILEQQKEKENEALSNDIQDASPEHLDLRPTGDGKDSTSDDSRKRDTSPRS
jgi:DNA-binding transcriptional ArsR family regulator